MHAYGVRDYLYRQILKAETYSNFNNLVSSICCFIHAISPIMQTHEVFASGGSSYYSNPAQ